MVHYKHKKRKATSRLVTEVASKASIMLSGVCDDDGDVSAGVRDWYLASEHQNGDFYEQKNCCIGL